VSPINIGILFEQAGQVEQAIDWFRIAFETYDPAAPYIGVIVQSPAVLSHPRFIELLRDMRLDHWVRVYSETEN
jgi:hypothetical protein